MMKDSFRTSQGTSLSSFRIRHGHAWDSLHSTPKLAQYERKEDPRRGGAELLQAAIENFVIVSAFSRSWSCPAGEVNIHPVSGKKVFIEDNTQARLVAHGDPAVDKRDMVRN